MLFWEKRYWSLDSDKFNGVIGQLFAEKNYWEYTNTIVNGKIVTFCDGDLTKSMSMSTDEYKAFMGFPNDTYFPRNCFISDGQIESELILYPFDFVASYISDIDRYRIIKDSYTSYRTTQYEYTTSGFDSVMNGIFKKRE